MIGFIAIISIVLVLGISIILLKRKRKISSAQCSQFMKIYNVISQYDDLARQILDYDSLLHKVLQARGHQGSFGAILKAKPTMFRNLQSLWFAHKLRNTIAHEVGYHVNPKDAKRAIATLQKEIQYFLSL